jgi:hypothetical protein
MDKWMDERMNEKKIQHPSFPSPPFSIIRIHSYHRTAINTEYNKLPITLTRSNSSKFGGY